MSAMNQADTSLVTSSNVTTDVVLVNQCGHNQLTTDHFTSAQGQNHRVVFVCTTERGLSRSRNMAIRHATADVCMIADDDEHFSDTFARDIARAYSDYPEADVIVFQVDDGFGRSFPDRAQRVGYMQALKTYSLQISFRRERVVEKGIWFDEQMGSGTGHGAGEENKFLFDCLRSGLRIQYVPVLIAATNSQTPSSQWFSGYTDRFFFNRGWATRRYLGTPLAMAYAVYYAYAKRKMYKGHISPLRALWHTWRGTMHVRYPENAG